MHEMTMPMNQSNSYETRPPPYGPLPQRVSSETPITLQHASHKASPGSDPPRQSASPSSPRRHSSGGSQNTGQSDPKQWFDHSNENPGVALDNTAMDVDPPFFQKQSNLLNEEMPYRHGKLASAEQSSSADDYRSVIDDLTVEIQRLKEELKRYKQHGPDTMRKDKLFEIKVHGLPKKKKRELEAKLRDFAAGLEGSTETSSSQKKKHSFRHNTRDRMYSASGSMSKEASSSSGSHFRPTDSAYASMSTGAHSSGVPLSRPGMAARAKASEQKVESYLRDIPEGLYPRHMALTEKEKKKLVVRRLEQLFTGKIGGRHAQKGTRVSQPANVPAPPIIPAPRSQPRVAGPQPSAPPVELSREARILPLEQQSGVSGKKSADIGSNSNEDQTESGGNGNSSGSGVNTSPPVPPPPEQRPTRIKDLDPDRVQVPSENMNYIRHLGMIAPELLTDQQMESQGVQRDADGWVYLNLLCNLAQLHIMNVTSDFVRVAVSERSAKFQLSPDGRKIRWRGGSEGTKFSSDSSGYNSQKSPSTDDTDSPNKGSHKRQKTGHSTGESGSSRSKNASKSGPQVSTSSESFHYKPLFVRHDSSGGLTSMDETPSSFGPAEESNIDSRWNLSGSGTTSRKRCRYDGAIIYYSGVPFCTDLSGDPGDASPATRMASNAQEQRLAQSPLRRTNSGSFLSYRPLSDKGHWMRSGGKMEIDDASSSLDLSDENDDVSDIELDLTWSDKQQYLNAPPLEACGLGGVQPEDHFMVVVSTRRPKSKTPAHRRGSSHRTTHDDNTDAIIQRLASMSTSSPVLRAVDTRPRTRNDGPGVEVEYLTDRIQRLKPVELPPAAMFFPPFSADSSTTMTESFDSEADNEEVSEEFESHKGIPHQSDGYPDGLDLSSGDEEGYEAEDSPDKSDDGIGGGRTRAQLLRERLRGRSKSTSAEAMAEGADGSSVATAGGAGSGFSSSDEESS